MDPNRLNRYFVAITGLLHDLSDPTQPVDDHDLEMAVSFSSRSAPKLDEVLLHISSLLVRNNESVSLAARTVSHAPGGVGLEFLVCSDVMNATENSYQPPNSGITVEEVMEAHQRELNFQEHALLTESLLRDWISALHEPANLGTFRRTLFASICLNSAPYLIRTLDINHPNISLFMGLLENFRFEQAYLANPITTNRNEYVFLRMIGNSVLWAQCENESKTSRPNIDLLSELVQKWCEEDVVPQYSLWTQDHWRQLANMIIYVLCHISKFLFSILALSEELQHGIGVTPVMAHRLASFSGILELLYTTIFTLARSSLFFNLLQMLRPILTTCFIDRYDSSCACSSVAPRYIGNPEFFYIDWIDKQCCHLEAFNLLGSHYRAIVCRTLCEHTLKKTIPLTVNFRFLPITGVPVAPDPVALQRSRNALVRGGLKRFLQNSLHTNNALLKVVRKLKIDTLDCTATNSRRPSVHCALHLVASVTRPFGCAPSSDYYPISGSFGYCCSICFHAIKMLGFIPRSHDSMTVRNPIPCSISSSIPPTLAILLLEKLGRMLDHKLITLMKDNEGRILELQGEKIACSVSHGDCDDHNTSSSSGKTP